MSHTSGWQGEGAQTRIRLRTLGELDLRDADDVQLRAVLAQPKRIALLTYLAVARPPGFHQRDSLVGLLWPDQDSAHARGALRQALYGLRQSLGEGVLLTRGDAVAVSGEHFHCDVQAFEGALRSGDAAKAVDCWGGEFLGGFFISGAPEFERWLESERERLSRLFAETLEKLARTSAVEDSALSLLYWRRLAEHDRYSPRAALGLMEALAATGDAPAALRHAEQYARLFREELGAQIDPQVAALAKRLKSWPAPTRPPESDPSSAVGPEPVLAAAADRSVETPARAPGGVEDPPAAQGSSGRGGARARAGKPLRTAGLLLLLLLLASAPWWLPGGGARRQGITEVTSGTAAPPRVTLAVLPLRNLSTDRGQDLFSDGFTQELIDALAKVEGLRVTGWPSSFAFKGGNVDVTRAADSLGVAFVVDGGVSLVGDRVQVDARLLNGRDGSLLWSRSYRRDVTDLWLVREEIARSIVIALETRVATPSRLDTDERLSEGSSARMPLASVHAFELYARGHLSLNRWNPKSVDSAIAALEAAVAADPSFAPARALLANAYLEKSDLFDPRDELRSRAYVQTETALFMDPGLAEAHVARGNLLWTDANHFPHEAALREFRRAVELRPSYSYAHDRLALIYLHVGLLDSALQEAREAAALDPLDLWARFRLPHILLEQLRFREAAEEFQRLPADVSPAMRGSFLAQALANLGRGREATPLLDSLVVALPRDPLVRATRALLWAVAGDSVRARSFMAAAARRVPGFAHGHHAEFTIALAYAQLAKPDSALAWLERAHRHGYPCYPRYAGDPMLAGLRTDPRFQALLQRIKAESDDYRRRFGASAPASPLK